MNGEFGAWTGAIEEALLIVSSLMKEGFVAQVRLTWTPYSDAVSRQGGY
jgi:hypothetical protein